MYCSMHSIFTNLLILLVLFLQPLQAEDRIPSVHPILPFTTYEDLVPCSSVTNYEEQFTKALECSVNNFFKASHKELSIPKCFVVTKKSPDLLSNPVFNSISLTTLTADGAVGFFSAELDTIFVTENYDLDMIIRHEVQHYLLEHYYSDGDAMHSTDIWKVCEPRTYTPSKEAVIVGVLNYAIKNGIKVEDIKFKE